MKSIALGLFACLYTVQAWTFFGEPRIEPQQEVTDACLSLANVGSCDFFTCLEDRFPCGHDGYAIKIAKYFCERGLSVNSMLTPDGQMFRNKTVACQTSMLLPVYESYTSRCGDITDQGVSSMLFCSRREYNGVDFCSFIRNNVDAHNEMFGMEEISRIIGLRKPSLLTRLFVDGGTCGAQSLMDRVQTLTGSFNDFIGTMTDSFTNFRNRVTNWWNSV